MNKINKLTAKEVFNSCNLENQNFETTKDVTPLKGIVRQNNAKESITFGLKNNKYGYNIYCSGANSLRKKTFLKNILPEFATKKEVPNDLCYIYNFKEETVPTLISLPAGEGTNFKKDMEKFKEILSNIHKVFSSKKYFSDIDLLRQDFIKKQEALYNETVSKLKELNHSLEENEKGISIHPIKEDGSVYTEKEFYALDEKAKEDIFNKRSQAEAIVKEWMSLENEIIKQENLQVKKFNEAVVEKVVKHEWLKIVTRYNVYDEKIDSYMAELYNNIFDNIDFFYSDPEKDKDKENTLALFSQKKEDNPLDKYNVNLLVDNSKLKNAPVIFIDDFDYHKFFGIITYDIDQFGYKTDYNQIVAGEMIKANGGYLVVDISELFKDPYTWNKIKKILKNKKTSIGIKPYKDVVLKNSLKPEEIPVDIKLILVGDTYFYYTLMNYDQDFQELFKINAIFESTVERGELSEKEYIEFISSYCENNGLKHLTKDAVEKVIEYSSRLAGNQNELTLKYDLIYKLLDESDSWAEIDNKEFIDAEIIKKTLNKQIERCSYFKKSKEELYHKDIFKVETTGMKIGEINGLAVSRAGEMALGHPSKVTVNTYKGKYKVSSVDRNSDLSGKIYDKGLEITEGFIGKTFGKENIIPYFISISFEQMYGGIDGDSATSTATFCILSELSDTPINQSIAVTGSMNQKGDIQAIGGVNEKIEGFYELCKYRGLTGTQGVIIPKSNVEDLMLSEEVRNSIEKNEFHIYPIERVEEGIEILTGVDYSKIANSINHKIKRNSINKENELKEQKK